MTLGEVPERSAQRRRKGSHASFAAFFGGLGAPAEFCGFFSTAGCFVGSDFGGMVCLVTPAEVTAFIRGSTVQIVRRRSSKIQTMTDSQTRLKHGCPTRFGTRVAESAKQQLEDGLDCFDALHSLGVRLIELRILLATLCWLGQDQHAARRSLGESRRPELLHMHSVWDC